MKRSSDPEPEGTGPGVAAGADSDGLGDEVALEEAAEAEAWLAGCRAAEARGGGSSHDVGAGPIADPALAGLVERLRSVAGELVRLDPVGRDGHDLLETLVELRRESERLAGAVAHVASTYEASKEWRLKAGSGGIAPGASVSGTAG